MASMTMTGPGNAENIASVLCEAIQNDGLSCELIDWIRADAGGSTVHCMVFEKYYMRAENRLSLTVLVTQNDDLVTVNAVGAGGGRGAIFKFAFGAEEDFLQVVSRTLSGYGFVR